MNNIKAIREKLGLTQTALARCLGCTQGNIGHYENKNQTIPPETARRLIALAAELGHEIGYEDVYGPIAKEKVIGLVSQRAATSS